MDVAVRGAIRVPVASEVRGGGGYRMWRDGGLDSGWGVAVGVLLRKKRGGIGRREMRVLILREFAKSLQE